MGAVCRDFGVRQKPLNNKNVKNVRNGARQKRLNNLQTGKLIRRPTLRRFTLWPRSWSIMLSLWDVIQPTKSSKVGDYHGPCRRSEAFRLGMTNQLCRTEMRQMGPMQVLLFFKVKEFRVCV